MEPPKSSPEASSANGRGHELRIAAESTELKRAAKE